MIADASAGIACEFIYIEETLVSHTIILTLVLLAITAITQQDSIMVAGGIQTIAQPTAIDHRADKIVAKDKLQGDYKEAFAQAAHSTNYDGELKGTDKHPPAAYPHYLP